MKIFRALLGAFLFVLPALAYGQLTTITGTGIRIGGNLIPTGTVCAVAVDVNNNPISVAIGGGGMRGVGQSCANIVAGVITTGVIDGGTYQIPDEALAGNPGFFYTFVFTDTQRGSPTYNQSFQLIKVPNITGSAFALDRYVPTITVPTLAAFTFTTGSGAPTGACAGKAFYQNIVTPSAPVLYQCGSDLGWHIISASSLTIPSTGSVLKGNGSGGVSPAVAGTDFDTAGAAAAAVTTAETFSANANNLSGGTVPIGRMPAITGDVTTTAGGTTAVLPVVNTVSGTCGDATHVCQVITNPKGQTTSQTQVPITGTGGSTGPAPIAGAIADYTFLQGSGTTLTDISGNGNNATLGTSTLAPTWTTIGLNFTQASQVILPSTLNTANTFFFGVYMTPGLGQNVFTTAAYATLTASSLGTSGLNLLYAAQKGNLVTQGAFAPSIYGPAGGEITGTDTFISGFHVLTYVLGTGSGSLDHFYIDGVETTYNRQGSSAGVQTGGNLFLGNANSGSFSGSGFVGSMYRFAALSTNSLTAAQILAFSGQIRADAANRGIAVNPAPVPLTTANLYAIGDSITFGGWPASMVLTNQPSYVVGNYGVPSGTIAAILSSEPNRIAPVCASLTGPAVTIVFAGTNDLQSAAQTPATVFSYLLGEIQVLKRAGCKVFVGTMISRGGTSGSGPTMDAQKDSYDALILSNARVGGADGIVDFAASPNLGADGANANATYFNSDNTHPTTTGYSLMAAIASNSLNYHFGSSIGNPTLVTATTHTIASGEGYISANPAANQTLTLPDCTGPSGAIYTVTNIQSAFTVDVVAGSSSQLINGLSVGTAVSVPSNSSVAFRDVPNPKNVSGCHWEK
jgi:lysophospholipase L1-like esterase